MKTSKLKLLACLVLFACLAGEAFANPGPPPTNRVPDAGASSMMLALSMGAIGLARNFFSARKS